MGGIPSSGGSSSGSFGGIPCVGVRTLIGGGYSQAVTSRRGKVCPGGGGEQGEEEDGQGDG